MPPLPLSPSGSAITGITATTAATGAVLGAGRAVTSPPLAFASPPPAERDAAAAASGARLDRSGGARSTPAVTPMARLSEEHGEGDPEGDDEGNVTFYSGRATDDAVAWLPTRDQFWSRVLRGGYVKTAVRNWYAPLLFTTPCMALVIALWIAALGTSIYAAGQLPLGLEQQLVLPAGSYLKTYFDDQGAHRGCTAVESSVVAACVGPQVSHVRPRRGSTYTAASSPIHRSQAR